MTATDQNPEFEDQEVEISDVSDVAPDTSQNSEITEIDEEDQLRDYEKALNKSVTKAQIAKGNNQPYSSVETRG